MRTWLRIAALIPTGLPGVGGAATAGTRRRDRAAKAAVIWRADRYIPVIETPHSPAPAGCAGRPDYDLQAGVDTSFEVRAAQPPPGGGSAAAGRLAVRVGRRRVRRLAARRLSFRRRLPSLLAAAEQATAEDSGRDHAGADEDVAGRVVAAPGRRGRWRGPQQLGDGGEAGGRDAERADRLGARARHVECEVRPFDRDGAVADGYVDRAGDGVSLGARAGAAQHDQRGFALVGLDPADRRLVLGDADRVLA